MLQVLVIWEGVGPGNIGLAETFHIVSLQLCFSRVWHWISWISQAVLIYEDELKAEIEKLPPAPLQLPSMPTPKAEAATAMRQEVSVQFVES